MNKHAQIAIIVACLGGAGFLLIKFINTPSPTANEGPADVLHLICADASCGHGFSWERGTDTGAREPDTCPKCDTPAGYRAAKCQECGHYQMLAGHGTYESPCPGCGADLPPLREQE